MRISDWSSDVCSSDLRKLRELVFSLETDGFRTPDLTILAEHITDSGLREIVYQQEPDSQVHCVREDGVLATLTYHREQDVVGRSEEHTSELQSLMRISYAVF